ncbi:MAG: hypothetical protein IBJ11_11715 [Phycisphaerales bacterium]|nr:hypothetical protein [Phycisphaerales bacterium]
MGRISWKRWLAAGVVGGVFLLMFWVAVRGADVGGGRLGGWLAGYERANFDQNEFHRPTIEKFGEQWPRPDLRDYQSATTPGWHLALSLIRRVAGADWWTLRWINAVLTAGLLGLLAWACAARVSLGSAVALALPMVGSMYVFASGGWLVPDNAAWLLVLWVLLLGLKGVSSARGLVGAAVLLAALVFVRQIHVWAAAVLWASAWLGEGDRGGLMPGDADPLAAKVNRTGRSLLVAVPALLLLGGLVWLWGGATPPSFKSQHAAMNPAVPLTVLSVFGVLSLFFSGYLLPGLGARMRERGVGVMLVVIVGLLAGLAAAVLAESTWKDRVRDTGVWLIAKRFDWQVEGRSVVMVMLSGLGGAMLSAWACALGARERWLMLGAMAAFAAAHTANAMAWQRYYEPFSLMWLALAASMVGGAGTGGGSGGGKGAGGGSIAWSGPVLLALGLGALTVWSATKG